MLVGTAKYEGQLSDRVSDWELLQGCQRGEQAAFGAVVDRYERLVYSITRRYGLVHDDAVDVAQQTFMQMVDQIDRFHEDSNLKGWFGTVARRNAWRVLNRYDHERVESPESVTEIGELMGLQHRDELDQMFVVEWLHHGLKAIDERCQQLLDALYFSAEAPSYDDIANRLNIAKGSIGPTRKRCLAKLRTQLEASATEK